MYRGTDFSLQICPLSTHGFSLSLQVILWEEEIPSAGTYWICLSIKLL